MKKLIRIAMCILLLGFGLERAIDGRKLFAAESKAKATTPMWSPMTWMMTIAWTTTWMTTTEIKRRWLPIG